MRDGICAVNKERLGQKAVIFADDNGKPGEFIAILDCEDTGFGSDKDGDGIGTIQEGKCIDVYKPTLDECKEYMKKTKGRVWVVFIENE